MGIHFDSMRVAVPEFRRKGQHNLTYVDKVGFGRIVIGEPEIHGAFVRYHGT